MGEPVTRQLFLYVGHSVDELCPAATQIIEYTYHAW